ncbi:hypothetical protein [Catenulispora rubra]|uniref:hypothetical protein n=1 Tax=Catenulispora rubra TaxID=280293 RepID=UPI0018921F92|nr:hypothetical protein [Catenulispora rubra]
MPVVSVTGQGSGNLPGDLFPQWAGDPIDFTINAQATPDPSGTFQVTHRRSDGSLYTEFSGTVVSVTAAGQMAVVNGVITAADDPANPGLTLVGAKVAMTFDERPDGTRVGFVWGFAGQPVAEGQGAVPFFPLSSSSVVVNSGGQPGPTSDRTLTGGQPSQVPARQLSGTVTGVDPATGGYYMLTTDAGVAAGAATTTAQGTFTYSLYQPDIAKSTSYSGTIGCLDIGGDDAVATGQITASSGNATLVGKRVAWSVYDNGTDNWVSGLIDSAATPVHACQGPIPVAVGTGGHIAVTG